MLSILITGKRRTLLSLKKRPDGKIVGYQYDNDGNTSQITYPDGTVYGYTYDEISRMTDVSETLVGASATNLAHYVYTPLSQQNGFSFGNGASASFGYDAVQAVTSIKKQKDFVSCGPRPRGRTGPREQTFFGSFFQKRTKLAAPRIVQGS